MLLSEDMIPALKALNDKVSAIISKEVAHSKTNKVSVGPDIVAAQKPSSILWAGAPIYVNRFKPLVFLWTAIALYCIAISTAAMGVVSCLISFAVMFVAYDIYSGVLHIVLDHPGFITMPIMGQACLEFQWHHHIPDDLVRKDFLLVLGDLNLVTGVSIALHVLLSANMGTDPMVMMLIGQKVLMAFFGQFSHRSAHEISKKKRGPIVNFLQKAGIMISIGDHHRHHTPPHDDFFCLIGMCNTVLSAVHRRMRNPHVWLVIFIVWTFADINVLSYLMRDLLVPAGV